MYSSMPQIINNVVYCLRGVVLSKVGGVEKS